MLVPCSPSDASSKYMARENSSKASPLHSSKESKSVNNEKVDKEEINGVKLSTSEIRL